ncbi:hypothetical protein TNCV_1328871 [Trichonephila clavipes]|nr:hypothetical protein TNCV_1328871 [Trichonephila clavipes]
MAYYLWSCSTLLEEGVWQISKLGTYHWKQSVRNVPIWFQVTIDTRKRCACRVRNGYPNHHAIYRAPMTISNVSRRLEVSFEPPDMSRHNIACRTGTHLKKRHCAKPVFSFAIWHTIAAACLYSALSREAE